MSDQKDTKTTADPAELQKQLEAAQAELTESNDRYLRLRAEMDNFRKQQERRATDRVKLEKKALLLRVIETIDDLDRALVYQEVADRDSLLGALKHLHGQLNTILQREGVVSFTTPGETFDPHMHEAIERVDASGKPEGEIVQEMQRGYLFGDELLRPAKVHVSSGEDAATGK